MEIWQILEKNASQIMIVHPIYKMWGRKIKIKKASCNGFLYGIQFLYTGTLYGLKFMSTRGIKF